jgi:ADP-dependent NAD(P)H-hydrate dehydratase / NAD(P)H-hydrate epimerase
VFQTDRRCRASATLRGHYNAASFFRPFSRGVNRVSLDRFVGAFDRVFTAAQSRALDQLAIERYAIPGIVLMKRAGRAAWTTLRQRWPDAGSISVVCGRGNNAGDGYIVAGCAASSGVGVQLIQLGPASALRGDAASARDWAVGLGVVIQEVDSDEPEFAIAGAVIVDALLGTGVNGDVRAGFARAIGRLQAAGAPVLALDIPSGLCADTGRVLGVAVRADVTVTFIGMKRGLVTGSGPDYTGQVVLDVLDVPDACRQTIGGIVALQWKSVRGLLPARKATAYKHQAGHALIIGGDSGMGGAVAMAAEAALRVGAGLVSVATRAEHVTAVLTRRPEIMAKGVDSAAQIGALVGRATVIAVGPGLGRDDWGRALLDCAVDSGKPLVVDADGLHLLTRRFGTVGALGSTAMVLTPHVAEAAGLLGLSVPDVQRDRFAAVAALAARAPDGAAVLKGAGSLVANRHQVGVCLHGNPGMASAGMGDVLTGVVAGLMAQGLEAIDAANIGVCLHSFAADRVCERVGQRGLLATDLLGEMRAILNDRAD